MTKVGEHITLDIIGTTKEYDPSVFEKVIHDIAKAAKVTILNISKYKFEPQGFTILALLAESHISFHTFPEKGIISFDFFTCGKVNPSVAIDIIKKNFEHKRIVKKEFNRDTKSLYHDIYSSPGLQKSYVVNDVLEDFKSKVGQHIEILELEQFGKSLFIDGEIQVAATDEHLYSSTFVGAGLNLNQNNEFDEYRSKLFESKKSISVPSINSGESSSHYTTHVWGSSSKNISQIVSVYSEDFTVYNFTNQERLIDRNAFFNLGEGENVINRGDIELTYDFKNYKLPENDGNKNFAPSKYFEISINVVFDDKLYSNDINNGMFYTYASLSTDKEDDGVKIVSVKINNKETGIAKAYADNYITVRTTPFSGNAKIKLLFKFWRKAIKIWWNMPASVWGTK